MKTNISSKNQTPNLIPKDNNNNHVKPIKISSDNFITTGSITSKASNLNFNKVKTRNSAVNSTNNNDNKSMTNNNIVSANGNERERNSINNSNGNNNISKIKKNTSTSQIKDMKSRKDAKGVPIIKGKKKHRVTFKDMLDKKFELIDEVEIESYKEYNAKELTIIEEANKKANNDNLNDNTSCTCLIF